MVSQDASPFGIYVHIPFCTRKCAYCDFVSYPRCESLFGDYVRALLQEARRCRRDWPGTADTLFIGGGTPTVLPGPVLADLVGELSRLFGLGDDAEISVEVNPGTLDARCLILLQEAGVNRLSIGVQSFSADELQLLGRIHSADEAEHAYRTARSAGFLNINLDLIYGLPRQTVAKWENTLRRALALGPEHLALYSLSIERGTPLERDVASGSLPEPDDDSAASMYEMAELLLHEAGYVHYEISNWARSTQGDAKDLPRLACRHNLKYWHNERYLGLGVAAYSYDGTERYGNVTDVQQYTSLVQAGEDARDEVELTGLDQQMDETMMLGLRLIGGITWRNWRKRFEGDARAVYGEQIGALERVGLLEVDAEGMRLSPRGRLLGNRVFAEFLRDA